MGGSVESIPQGNFKTLAVLVEKDGQRSQHTGTTDEGSPVGAITGGSLYISVMARDPYTGQAVRIDGVKVEQTLGTLVTGIPEAGMFELTCPSYEGFKSRDPSGITALPKNQDRTVQNTALPSAVKVKNTVDNFSATSNSPVCRKYDENIAAAQRNLGLVHERDDLQVLQGPENGSSPGVAVDQKGGAVYMFGNDGKQNIQIAPGGGVKMVASSVDTGSAQKELESLGYGGMPQIMNPMNNVIPQGTIVSPQPGTIPNIIKILNMVATIVDMADLIKCCADAVKAVKKMEGREQSAELQKIQNTAAGPSRFEKMKL